VAVDGWFVVDSGAVGFEVASPPAVQEAATEARTIAMTAEPSRRVAEASII
jgi:hypothetical protein